MFNYKLIPAIKFPAINKGCKIYKNQPNLRIEFKQGPPCAWNPSFLIRRVKDQINPPSGPPSGSHIANDDDWAIAPPSHTQSQKLPTMNYGFEGVSNAKEYPGNCPRLGAVNPGWQ